eukprot:Mrub_04948.p1 GENE.Mrub_04948~~Mrub_04948.p1  ORF type:complete len:396 (-),score=85.82 Mrub_04948:6-1094(-)
MKLKENECHFNAYEIKISNCYNEYMSILRITYGNQANEFEYYTQINNIYKQVRVENQKKYNQKLEDIDHKIKNETDWLDNKGNFVINDTKNRHRSLADFLKQLKEKFPSRNNSTIDVPEKYPDIDTMKKAITKSQLMYHPDKNLNQDEEWRRLSYRISQKLNDIFDTMKSCNESHSQKENENANNNRENTEDENPNNEENNTENENETDSEDEDEDDDENTDYEETEDDDGKSSNDGSEEESNLDEDDNLHNDNQNLNSIFRVDNIYSAFNFNSNNANNNSTRETNFKNNYTGPNPFISNNRDNTRENVFANYANSTNQNNINNNMFLNNNSGSFFNMGRKSNEPELQNPGFKNVFFFSRKK